MFQHMQIADPDLQIAHEDNFRFSVEQKFKSAFNRQLAEVVSMKHSNAVILNLKDE